MIETTIYTHEETSIVEARARCTKCEANDKSCAALNGDFQTMINRCIDALNDCEHL